MIGAIVIEAGPAVAVLTPLATAGIVWLARRASVGRNAEISEMTRREIVGDMATRLEAVGAEQTRQHTEMRELVGRNHAQVSRRLDAAGERMGRIERDLSTTKADVAYLRGRQDQPERSTRVDL